MPVVYSCDPKANKTHERRQREETEAGLGGKGARLCGHCMAVKPLDWFLLSQGQAACVLPPSQTLVESERLSLLVALFLQEAAPSVWKLWSLQSLSCLGTLAVSTTVPVAKKGEGLGTRS